MAKMVVILQTLGATILNKTQPEKIVGEDIYIVMYVTLIVWLGVFFYLLYLGKKVKYLKQKVDSKF